MFRALGVWGCRGLGFSAWRIQDLRLGSGLRVQGVTKTKGKSVGLHIM